MSVELTITFASLSVGEIAKNEGSSYFFVPFFTAFASTVKVETLEPTVNVSVTPTLDIVTPAISCSAPAETNSLRFNRTPSMSSFGSSSTFKVIFI